MNIRRLLLKIARPFIKIMHGISLPKRKLKEAQVWELISHAKKGDIILSRKNFELTNILIPGTYKHAAIVTGDRSITEAVEPVVREVGFFEFCLKSDKVALVRAKKLDYTNIKSAMLFAKMQIGRGYDHEFISSNRDLYCSELCYQSLAFDNPGFSFKPREILGEMTISPDDFVNAKKHFDIIWQSE